MKKVFTQKIVLTALLAVCGLFLQAQVVNTLTVTSPASLAGDYPVNIAPYGQQLTGSFTGTATFADDGVAPNTDACDGDITNVTGKIAFIDRGTCEFGAKSLAGENAGAVAVVICNNDATTPDLIPALAAGAVGDMVNIPTVAMSYNNCQTLRAIAEGGDIEVDINYVCLPPSYGPEVIWGQVTGQGDFAGGLNDWTVVNGADSSWYYEPTGYAGGAFTNDFINSPTVCNGAMVFSSDLLDNAGTFPGSTGSGAGGCAAPCTGSLISPTIDLTQFSDLDALFLQFHQRFRHFAQTSSSLLLSKNGGVTWPDTFVLNGDAVVNAASIDEVSTIPLFGYEDANSITMRFEHVGNYYFWSIDDVRISNLPSFVDVQLNSNWYAAPTQWRTPADQITEQPFITDMFNNGNLTADDLSVTVDVTDAAGTSVFTTTQTYPALPGFELNENTVFDEVMNLSSLPPGDYNGTYTVNAISGGVTDNNADNNTIGFSFVVTDDVYSNAPNAMDVADLSLFAMEPNTDGSIFANGASQEAIFWSSGSCYRVRNGEGMTVKNVRFGVTEEEQVASGFIHIQLYEVSDADLSQGLAPDERVLVGATSVVIDTVMDKSLIDVQIFKADETGTFAGEEVELKDNTSYMLTFLTQPLAGDQIDLLSYPSSSTTAATGRNWYHFPAQNAFIASGNPRPIGTFFEPLIDGTPADFASTTIDFYAINTLYNEMTIGMESGVNDFNGDISLSVYPNPTSNFANIALNLDNTSDVQVEVFDVQGRRVLDKTWTGLQQETIVMNVQSLTTGTYSMKIKTDDGFVTKPLVITK